MNRLALQKRGLGVLFLAVVVGLLYLSILFYNHAFTKVATVTLYAGCQGTGDSGGAAPENGSGGSAQTASATQPESSVIRPVLSAKTDPPVCGDTSTQNQNAGHSLDVPADVKLRGIIVGTVSKVDSTGNGAVITLKLQPDKLKDIPKNVTAEIIPKTLFGEKYVSLIIPKDAVADRIQAGDQIDQSATAIEAEQVFNDLVPLLQTLQPAELSTTLTNVAEALQGRGNELGDNLARTDTYLAGLNPDIAGIQQNLTGLETLASNVNQATPDILAQLRQFSVNANTLSQKGPVFAGFLKGSRGFADVTTQVLTQNEQNIVQLAKVSQPTLKVLAQYSPEYSCLLQGLAGDSSLLSQAFTPRTNNTAGPKDNVAGLHLNLTIDTKYANGDAYGVNADGTNDQFDYGILTDNRVYPNPGNASLPLVGGGTTGGPCYGLPGQLKNPINIDPPINKSDPNYCPPGSKPANCSTATTTSSASARQSSYSGSAPLSTTRLLLAPELGTSAGQVSDFATLLVAPQLVGSQVSVS